MHPMNCTFIHHPATPAQLHTTVNAQPYKYALHVMTNCILQIESFEALGHPVTCNVTQSVKAHNPVTQSTVMQPAGQPQRQPNRQAFGPKPSHTLHINALSCNMSTSHTSHQSGRPDSQTQSKPVKHTAGWKTKTGIFACILHSMVQSLPARPNPLLRLSATFLGNL